MSAVPLFNRLRLTRVSVAETRLCVAVRVNVPAPSLTVLALGVRVTSGRASSSMIVTVALSVMFTELTLELSKRTTKVSLSSARLSSIDAILIVLLVTPKPKLTVSEKDV